MSGTAPFTSDMHTVIPIALRIPSIGLDSYQISKKAFMPLGLVDKKHANARQPVGSMEVPPTSDPTRFGFYCPNGLPKCGAPSPSQPGGAVIVSHVNGASKPGGFFKLAKVTGASDTPKFNVNIGDTIEVDLADQTTQVFKVTRLLTPDKTNFPTAAVWPLSAKPQLSLITCGGELNKATHSYLQQIIVIADWVSSRPLGS